ncbi:MAG: hypothetical protein IPG86_01330 [Chitinophagaceae bacterium]|nr:hypothetical protein [Chitinophagaceae bacterium]
MKKVFSNTAILSALLIFVGYLDIYIYYNEFGINISTYLTTGELILSFLPLTIPLLILVSFFFIPAIGVLTSEQGKHSRQNENRVKPKEYTKMAARNLKRVWKIIRQKRVRRPVLLFLFTLLEIIRLVYGIFYHIFFFTFILLFFISVFTSEKRVAVPILIWIIFTILWYLFFDDEIKRENRNLEAINNISAIIACVLFLGLVSIHKKDKAFLVLNGRQDFKVKFVYDTTKVETDTSVVYIGKTNEYLFLRERKGRINKVYEIDKVSLLEFIELER